MAAPVPPPEVTLTSTASARQGDIFLGDRMFSFAPPERRAKIDAQDLLVLVAATVAGVAIGAYLRKKGR